MTARREWEITRPITLDPMRPRGTSLADLARLEPDAHDPLDVGRYHIHRLLGKGGMSSVYHGEHIARGEPVAIKVLTRDLAEYPNALARFMNEAQLTAQVEHPNVVEVLDYGTTTEGLAYLVMPLYVGEDLRTILRREGQLPWPRVRSLLLQLCAALETVHAQSIVHRDIKPSNCLCMSVGDEEHVKLLDFGVARQINDGPEESVVGTPEYMSPEQARGDDVDTRSDIYSLGIMLGELVTGHVPFTGDSVNTVLDRQEHARPPSLVDLAERDVVLPRGLEAVYQRALAKDPTQRFANVAEFAAALGALDEHLPGWKFGSRWRPLVLAAGVALVVGVASAWMLEGNVPIHAVSAEHP
jgi:serine/threonine protein kinase